MRGFLAAALVIAAPNAWPQDAAPHWVAGTPVELMVIREVNSRTAKAGDRVVLRVNAPVSIDGRIVIPEGATAIAEVESVVPTKAAGGSGQLGIRLRYVETAWGEVPLAGSKQAAGSDNTSGVALGVLGFGVLGLLTKGHNASLKGGDRIYATIEAPPPPASPPAVAQP